jgi:NAD(P)-dependent dehydrogenase (short-subunit alcohol dehydrogenase family)
MMRSISQLLTMKSRVAAITGGAGHLGRAFGNALAQIGCNVCLLDVEGERAQMEAARLQDEFGIEASAFAVDISDERAVDAAAEHVRQYHGRLDVLINNAAYPSLTSPNDGASIEEQTLGRWEPNVEVSLRGTFLASRTFVPQLRATKHGVIINIASIYGIVGPDMRLYEGTSMGNSAWYAAAKGGIVQLTRYFATTLAPDIRANCIAPGGVWRDQPESFHMRYIDRTPLRRMAVEEDLCGALVYFASDLSAYVTGQVLLVDGGWTAW